MEIDVGGKPKYVKRRKGEYLTGRMKLPMVRQHIRPSTDTMHRAHRLMAAINGVYLDDDDSDGLATFYTDSQAISASISGRPKAEGKNLEGFLKGRPIQTMKESKHIKLSMACEKCEEKQ